jgi:hypothetical protein
MHLLASFRVQEAPEGETLNHSVSLRGGGSAWDGGEGAWFGETARSLRAEVVRLSRSAVVRSRIFRAPGDTLEQSGDSDLCRAGW